MRRSSDQLAVLKLSAISRHAALLAIAFDAFSMARAEPLDVFRDCDVCPEMIELPLGEFLMGAPEDEFRRVLYWRDGALRIATEEEPYDPGNEGPQYRVTVDIPIAMGKNEITFAEWMACVADGGCGGYVPDNLIGRQASREAILTSLTDTSFAESESGRAIAQAMDGDEFISVRGDYPILRTSYRDAQSYIRWLNEKLDVEAYRLPTEAEWEYAARGGTSTRFAQGDELLPNQANFSGEQTGKFLLQARPDLLTRGYPVQVDELDAENAWGLRHMSGNVAELTLSCYTQRYVGWEKSSVWLREAQDKTCERTERGGGYAFSMDTARVAWRQESDEASRTQYVGFRIVKELR